MAKQKLSPHSYAHLNLTEHEVPGIKDMPVGSKHTFTVEAEHVETRKNEGHDGIMPMHEGMGSKEKGMKMPKFSARFKVVAVDHHMPKKMGKMPRYGKKAA